MRDVDEISFLWLNARCHFECLSNAQMSRVRLLAQRIDDQTFNAQNLLHDLIRHRAAIAEISDELALTARKHVAIHLRLAVGNRQRRDRFFTQPKWSANKMGLRFQGAVTWVGALACEQ